MSSGLVLFQFIGESVDTALNSFINITAANVISTFTHFAVLMTTIYFIMIGYMMVLGTVQGSISKLFITMLKCAVVASIALNASTYTSWVVDSIRSLEEGFTQAFSGAPASTSVYQVVDDALADGWGISGDLWESAGNRGWSEIGMAMGEYINSIIIAVATGLLGIPAGGMIVVAKAGLTLMLGIGPFFIMALMWPVTARYFDAWFGQVMTYVMRIALMAAVLSFAIKIFRAFVGDVDLASTQNPLFTSLQIVGLTLVMFWLLREAYSVAGHLASGASSAALSVGGMIRGAVSPVSMTAGAVNRSSTRRDLQSGMMVTSGRLNHLVAGNTMWNPAYRQHVGRSIGKNWGAAAGGKVGRAN